MRIPMRIAVRILGCCLLASCSPAFSQAAAPAKPAVGTAVPPAQVYGNLLTLLEKEFVSAAEAMPDDKFDFAPPATAGEFKGVRSFSAQLKHVAEANYYFFGTLSEAELKVKSDAIDKLTTKADIVKALKDSFTQAHAYVDAITPENAFVTIDGDSHTRGGMAAFGIAHFMDHYGQLVVYLRMNGIVPPASRGGM
jgi:uncharacterized damage-inducible protein DinB